MWSKLGTRCVTLISDRRHAWLYRRFTLVRLALAYLYDARRFSRSAQLIEPFKNRLTARAHLLRTSHSLERGQALPEPRPGFGAEKIRNLLADTACYQERFGCDEVSFVAVGVLRGIQEFHTRTGHAREDWETPLRQLEEAESRAGRACGKGIGSLQMTRAEVLEGLPPDPEAFFRRRCSVRQFEPGPIERELLERAIRLAQKSPSVCNRQGGRVHIYTDKDDMCAVLKHQDGNAGFGHEAAAVMVVTADLSCFYREAERNQGFVDGGMFAVSIAYALHSLGLGSCMLNWSRSPRADSLLRQDLRLPDNEAIITMLAAGRLRDSYRVAASPRRPLSEVLRWHSLKSNE